MKKNKSVYGTTWNLSDNMAVLTGGAVELSKNFINDKPYKGKVTSTLIYGVQWDVTLKFFNDENYLKNSTGKGWYDYSSTGNPKHFTGIDVDLKASNKIKNIYDMAGNIAEWTMEAYNTNNRVIRGGKQGDFGRNKPASYRYHNSPYYTDIDIGFRLALYF